MSAETVRSVARGYMDDGERYFVPGVNCWSCGRFVGRDGWIEFETFEMSWALASIAGQCGRCAKGGRE